MHEIDGTFREKREKSSLRRRSRRNRRIATGIGVLALLAVCGSAYLLREDWLPTSQPAAGNEAAVEEVPVEEEAVAVEPSFVPALLDLAGDPMLISLGGSAGGPKLKTLPRPQELMEPGISERVYLLSDTMISSSERFMTTLPSSPEDFAFFQAQSARVGPREPAPDDQMSDHQDQALEAPDEIAALQEGVPGDEIVEEEDPEEDFELAPVDGQNDGGEAAGILAEGEIASEYEADPNAVAPGYDADDTALPSPQQPTAAPPGTAPVPQGSGVPGGDAAAGWGETVTDGQENLPSFSKTRIENTTSTAFVAPERDRKPSVEDFFVRVFGDRTIDSIARENGFSPEDAKRIGEALVAKYQIETLKVGDVVAMRGYRSGPEQTLAQLTQTSIYRGEDYIGTLSLADDGSFADGADPWVKDDLFHYSRETADAGPKKRYRYLDAIYSTAVRNNVPTGVIGEVIKFVSRSGFDLQALVEQDDMLTILFSDTARDASRNAGRVLFVGLRTRSKNFHCYAYQLRAGSDFICMQEGADSETVTVTNGMLTPVNGVLTSTFGPRKHPILKQVRIHKGVDWAAPIGTPVMAAFDGTIEFAGDNGNYGNFVRINHAAGRASGYAHLDRFAPDTKVGLKVTAGDIIGYVGTTGLSTGPHLHFELYQSGQAVNPLASTLVAGGSDDSAVETLVNRIIRVESGGNHTAKNPLSTATGLGQFIESTWLRMMRTYRPELAKSLSKADLLALRFDPTISREMVANLARESEAKLRAFGHGITAGRLYLAHFLGVDGANRVLSASPAAAIDAVVDAGVVPANPFLRGMTAADVINWAERKMKGKGYKATVSVSQKTISRTPPEFLRYKEATTKLLEASGAVL